MNARSLPVWADTRSCVERRDKDLAIWSVHVDEFRHWKRYPRSFSEWLSQLILIYTDARETVGGSEVVAITLPLEPTIHLNTFGNVRSCAVDFEMPPSLYVLKEGLDFPPAGEEYFRVFPKEELNIQALDATLIVRSARSLRGLRDGCEFDNALYICSRFERLEHPSEEQSRAGNSKA